MPKGERIQNPRFRAARVARERGPVSAVRRPRTPVRKLPIRYRSTMIACDPVSGIAIFLRNLEAPPGFEPGMEVLQTSALPLGDGAGRSAQNERGNPAADDTAINSER